MNLKNIFPIFLFLTFNLDGHSQQPLDTLLQHQDSIKNFYSGPYSDTIVDGIKLKKISQYTSVQLGMPNYYYGKIEIKNGNIKDGQAPATFSYNDCNPCYLYDYRYDGTLWSEGVMKTDCPYRHLIIYYRDGKVAITGNRIPNIKGKTCSFTQGEIAVYNHNGDKIISEFWNKGKLVKTVPYKLNTTGDVKFSTDDKTFLINDTIKASDFQKLKLSPDTNQNVVLKNGYNVRLKVWQKKKLEFFRFENMESFADSTFQAQLKKKKIRSSAPMQINIDIYETEGNEIIETHFLVLDMKKHHNE